MEDLAPRYIKYGCISVDDNGRPDAYDGDSVRLKLDLGHGIWIDDGMMYRLSGIQAPERPATSVKAKQSKEYLQQQIERYQLDLPKPAGGGFWLSIRTVKKQGRDDYRPKEKKGSFGRYLVELYGKDEFGVWLNINNKMLLANHAKPYVR